MEKFIKNIYSDILEMSDIETQKRLWLNQNNDTGLSSSYVEMMCRLFDDNNVEGFIKNVASEGRFSEIVMELRKLISLLNSYNEKESDEEIIEDPEWHKVVEQARVVLNIWNSKNSEGLLCSVEI